MTTDILTVSTGERSPLLTARLTGVFWLLTFLTGSASMVAPASRWGVAVNLVSTACYVGATVFAYSLLKPVNRHVSLLAMFFSLVGCAIGALAALAVLAPQAPRVAFLFFGLHCITVGYLILRSTFLPRAVGALMVFGGLGWLAFSIVALLSPTLAKSLGPYLMIPGILGEATLTLWLLVKGVNVERWNERRGRRRPYEHRFAHPAGRLRSDSRLRGHSRPLASRQGRPRPGARMTHRSLQILFVFSVLLVRTITHWS